MKVSLLGQGSRFAADPGGPPAGMGAMARQGGGKSPSFVLRLTGTSRGVPGSDGRGRRPAGGITQCLPTQVRLQLLRGGSWDARRGRRGRRLRRGRAVHPPFPALARGSGVGGEGGVGGSGEDWRRAP